LDLLAGVGAIRNEERILSNVFTESKGVYCTFSLSRRMDLPAPIQGKKMSSEETEKRVLFWFAGITQSMFDSLRGSEVETYVPKEPKSVIVELALGRLKDREIVANELGHGGMEKLRGMLDVWAEQLRSGEVDPHQPAAIRRMLTADKRA
jgi:hypothetical protein